MRHLQCVLFQSNYFGNNQGSATTVITLKTKRFEVKLIYVVSVASHLPESQEESDVSRDGFRYLKVQ